MEFREILKNNKEKNIITLGENPLGFLNVNIKEKPSIIITGETGSGKSILLDQIILELITKYTSLELSLVLIDTSGVELNYYENTNYTKYVAINNLDRSIVALSRVLKEIEDRKKLIHDKGVTTIDEFNKIASEQIPMLVLAIDDDKLLLREPDVEKMLSGIISQLAGLNIVLILVTSDVHNEFFESDLNTLASLLISFDYTNALESKKSNIENANNLEIGAFYAKTKGYQTKYFNFDFDDAVIKEVMDHV